MKLNTNNYWVVIYSLCAFFLVYMSGGCAHLRQQELKCSTPPDRPELKGLCAKSLPKVGIPISVTVTYDGAPYAFLNGRIPKPRVDFAQNHAYSYVTGGQRPKCYIVLQEQHMSGNLPKLIKHEALHCAKWVNFGDPDRGHCGPGWDFVGNDCIE